jgi:Pyridoxamine 5'-phosphate oxidase
VAVAEVKKLEAGRSPIVATITTPSPSASLHGGEVLRDPLVRELLSARLICVLSTFDVRGIHAVAMWFALAGDQVLLATNASSRKVRNLQRDDRATIVVHDSRPGFEVCGVSIAGSVTVVRGSSARPFIDRVHRRYLTPVAAALPPAREFLESDDTALRFDPDVAWTWDERRTEASEAVRRSRAALPLVPTEPRPNTD